MNDERQTATTATGTPIGGQRARGVGRTTRRVARAAAAPAASVQPIAPADDAPEVAMGTDGFDLTAVMQPEPAARPTAQAAAPATIIDAAGKPEPRLTRRPRTLGGDASFDIPDKYKKPGQDYEWKTITVIGAAVDGSELAMYAEQHWTEVRPAEMPGMMAPGYEGKTIDRRGQRLFKRPKYLSEEAVTESYNIAETQKYDKLKSASSIPIGRPGLMSAQVDKMEISGEVGRAPETPNRRSAA